MRVKKTFFTKWQKALGSFRSVTDRLMSGRYWTLRPIPVFSRAAEILWTDRKRKQVGQLNGLRELRNLQLIVAMVSDTNSASRGLQLPAAVWFIFWNIILTYVSCSYRICNLWIFWTAFHLKHENIALTDDLPTIIWIAENRDTFRCDFWSPLADESCWFWYDQMCIKFGSQSSDVYSVDIRLVNQLWEAEVGVPLKRFWWL